MKSGQPGDSKRGFASRPIEAQLLRLLGIILRSPTSATAIVSLSGCVIFLFALRLKQTEVALSVLLVLTFALGALFVGLLMVRALAQAGSTITELSRRVAASPTGEFDAAEVQELSAPTGFAQLDDLLLSARRSGAHLLEMLAAMGGELQDVIDRYELLATNIAASVVIRDTAGKVLFCSPYTEVLTGCTLEEIQDFDGDFFESIVLESDRDRYRRAIAISTVGEDIVVRYQIRHQSGIQLWIETHLVPVLNSDGEIISVMGVSIDVTSSVSYQQRIEEQNRDLNDFTYMVSHDLKAPIFTIKGMASMLLEDLPHLEADSRESLEHIVEAANRLERMIKSVIEYSSLSTKEFREDAVPLDSVLADVLQDLSEQIRESNAQVRIEQQLPVVLGESLRLYQVFINLIGNAIKYGSSDRTPEITIAVRHHSSELVIIDVRDNGIGIPRDKQSGVFRPYQRAHNGTVEGSGIGLASVKKIVERLGGSVGLVSTEGRGTVLSVALRLAPPDTLGDSGPARLEQREA